ncbi:uncharacterized protein LOC115153262 isoform X1 [Salmo trutta]|uniref:uncharacterized protein LOC115153262 isoform X1 n=2 Tax=Salmo trutta TaxID=8032 RepID=UPI0011326CDF|nr:uncharacterized protein LOC115153262 isoform X1 [Salmo trutta]
MSLTFLLCLKEKLRVCLCFVDANGMSHFERSEKGGRQGHWRRRQHHWNGPDHFHNDNRGPVFQQYDGYAGPVGFRVDPRPFPPVGRHNGHTGALDELTLKHMAQDCSSVKNQLLTLKSLLQMEDGGPEEGGEEDNSMTLQLEELMKEVWKLREELRNKERTIAQLTQQQQQLQQQGPAHAAQSGRCHCHQRTPSLGGDRRTHHDKATQTSWRGQGHSQAPQIQPSSPSHHKHLTQERLVKTAHTEDHSDPQRGRRTRGDGSHCTDSEPPAGSLAMGVDTPPVPDPEELSVLLSTQLNIHVREGPGTTPSPTQGLAAASSPTPGALSRPEGGQRASPLGPQGPGCPRILQPPRLHKRVSIPALPQGGTNGSLLRSGSSALLANHRTKQLPPPSRGLTCFNSGPQAVSPSLDHGVLAKPRALGVRRDLGRTSPPSPSLEMPDLGLLRARVLVPPSLSCIPMPKIH